MKVVWSLYGLQGSCDFLIGVKKGERRLWFTLAVVNLAEGRIEAIQASQESIRDLAEFLGVLSKASFEEYVEEAKKLKEAFKE